MIVALSGCVWIVPKNGAVGVTTSNASNASVPVRDEPRAHPPVVEPARLRAFTDVAVNAPEIWLGVIAVVVSSVAVSSVFLS